jgi:hypothetical protein
MGMVVVLVIVVQGEDCVTVTHSLLIVMHNHNANPLCLDCHSQSTYSDGDDVGDHSAGPLCL